jgi:hypothetical protein
MNRIIRKLTSWKNLAEVGRTVAGNIYKLWQMFLHRQNHGFAHALIKVGKNISGQIATLLTLVMVFLLIMVLVIMNIGDVATKTTTMANAVDMAALNLGSTLSTRAGTLYEALGNKYEVCKKGGILNVLISAILAIIAVVVSIVTGFTASPLALTAIGAVAGAIGGGATAAIRGMNIGEGLLTGAMIGAAVGGGFAGGVEAVGTMGAGLGTSLAGGSIGMLPQV